MPALLPLEEDPFPREVPPEPDAALRWYASVISSRARRCAAEVSSGGVCVSLGRDALRRCAVTAAAVDAARDTLSAHLEAGRRQQGSWLRSVTERLNSLSSAAAEFEHAWDAAAHTPLLPSLAARMQARGVGAGGGSPSTHAASVPSPPPTSLADALPRERLRRAAASVASSTEALAAKAAEAERFFEGVCSDAAALFTAGPDADVDGLEARVAGGEKHLAALCGAAATVEGDSASVARLLQDCAPQPHPAPDAWSPADAVAAAAGLHGNHPPLLGVVGAAGAALRLIPECAATTRAALLSSASSQLRAVASVQSALSGLRDRRAALTEAVRAVAAEAAPLAQLRAAPAAYAAALAEVGRRRAAVASFAACAHAAAESLAALRAGEEAARDAASPATSALPPSLRTLLGLDAPPPLCELTLRGCETALAALVDGAADSPGGASASTSQAGRERGASFIGRALSSALARLPSGSGHLGSAQQLGGGE